MLKNALFPIGLFCFQGFLLAQDEVYKAPTLNIGDAAPSLMLDGWIKGKPIEELEKGKTYVIEFWATWCRPCIRYMPTLSKVAKKYKKEVTTVSVNILANPRYPKERARFIIDSMGRKANYRVAFQDSNKMETAWTKAFDIPYVPVSFVVNREGKIAWAGHPLNLEKMLPKIIDNGIDLDAERSKRSTSHYLNYQAWQAGYELRKYGPYFSECNYYGDPDSVCAIADRLFATEPALKFESVIVSHLLGALLKADQNQAYQYASELTAQSAKDEQYDRLMEMVRQLEYYADKITIRPELYLMGAKILEEYADKDHLTFRTMVDFYWRGGDKKQALLAQKKGYKVLQKKRNYATGFLY